LADLSERELALRITADATQAKAELDALQQSEQGLVASTTQATAATSASANAMTAQGDAASQSSDQVSESADALNDAGSAATVAGLAQQRLQNATQASTTATVAGVSATKASTAATESDVIAETNQAAATRTAATAAQQKATAETQEAVATRASAGAAEADAVAELNDAAATGAATVATEQSALAHKLQMLSIQASGKAIAGHELSTAKLATGLLKMAAPVLGVVTVIALLPQVIKLVVDKTTEWSTKIGEMMVGLSDQAGVIRKAGESTEDYQKRVNEAADANEDFERGLNASRKGLVGVTADSEKLRAEGILLAESMHQGSQSAEKLAFAYKELGLKMSESFKMEDAKLYIENFIAQYDRELKKGENSARHFTDANKEGVLARMEFYEDEGQAIPRDLQKIADKYDIVTFKQKESIETAKLQLEAWESLTPRARALVEQSEKFLAMGIKTGEAFIQPKLQVESLLDSIKKLETEGTASFAATLAAMGGSVDTFTTKAGFANAAIDALYGGDEDAAPFSTDLRPGAE